MDCQVVDNTSQIRFHEAIKNTFKLYLLCFRKAFQLYSLDGGLFGIAGMLFIMQRTLTVVTSIRNEQSNVTTVKIGLIKLENAFDSLSLTLILVGQL